MARNGYTPTQRAILKLLSDGQRHSKDEVFTCLPDDLASRNAVPRHISALRKKLNPLGEEIVCEFRHRQGFYRHVRLLASAYDGKR